MIVLNVFQLWAKLPADEGSLKDNKIAFLNDPKGQKRFFTVIDGGRRSAIVNTCFTCDRQGYWISVSVCLCVFVSVCVCVSLFVCVYLCMLCV